LDAAAWLRIGLVGVVAGVVVGLDKRLRKSSRVQARNVLAAA